MLQYIETAKKRQSLSWKLIKYAVPKVIAMTTTPTAAPAAVGSPSSGPPASAGAGRRGHVLHLIYRKL